jgi:hypothetical protein
MANDNPEGTATLDFTGTQNILALYADAFMVGRAQDGMFAVYFFQNQLPDLLQKQLRMQEELTTTKTTCVSRIVLSPAGMRKLVDAMASNMGLTVVEQAAAEPQGAN